MFVERRTSESESESMRLRPLRVAMTAQTRSLTIVRAMRRLDGRVLRLRDGAGATSVSLRSKTK